MIKYKIEIKEVELISSIVCDKCKKEIYPEDTIEWQEIFCIRLQGGYGSVFGDGNKVKIDLCQHCLYDLIGDLVE